MTNEAPLPPGQVERDDFPRFGLGIFANRFPRSMEFESINIRGDIAREATIGPELRDLPRVDLTADFHCVTTWSVRNLTWSGYRFRDFYEQVVVTRNQPHDGAKLVVFRGQDGYCSSLPLDDLLADDILLADRLNGEPLSIEHGAPLRLVAPAHYGYKNAKHVASVEFWRDRRHYRFPRPYPNFMDHPRGRVALEERGRWVPATVLRYLYRALVPSAVKAFRAAMERHES